MYKQVLDPVGDSLFYSSLFAVDPARRRCSSCSAG